MNRIEEFRLFEPSPPIPPSREPPRRHSSSLRWLGAGTALIVGGVLAASPIDLGPRPPDQVAMLEVDAAAPPIETWRVITTDEPERPRQLAVIGDTVVTITDDVTGLDLDTGEVDWTVEIDTTGCRVHAAVTCVEAAGTPRAVVARIGADGAVIRIPAPGAVRAVEVGYDVIVLAEERAGRQIRRHAVDGRVLWSAALPPEVLPGESGGLEWVSLAVLGDLLHVSGAHVATLDVSDGELQTDPPIAFGNSGFGYYVYRSQTDRAFPDVALVSADGSVLVDHVVVVPDDEPGSDIEIGNPFGTLVTRGDDVLWHDTDAFPVARVDGVLVLTQWDPATGKNHLSGRDLDTGSLLWQRPGHGQIVAAGGSTMLLWEPLRGTLHGVDVRTGDDLWTTADGVRIADLALLPDGIVFFQGAEVVRLTW